MVVKVVDFVDVIVFIREGAHVKLGKNLIKSVFCIALVLALADKLLNLLYPGGGSSLIHLVEGLESIAVLIKNMDRNL